MTRVVFATCAASGDDGRKALLLAGSVRTFAAGLRSGAIWVLQPDRAQRFADALENRFAALGVETVPFAADEEVSGIPGAARAAAAAAAEKRAARQADLLVWMDPDSLVVGAADALLLPEGRSIGLSPVHLGLIGSPWERPATPFWSLLYRKLRVKRDAVFPVTTIVDRRRVRAYFDAGLVVARPAEGALRRWHRRLVRLAGDAAVKAFFIEDASFHAFFHQAVLAASVLASVPRDSVLELPAPLNYPLHLLERIPAERRPWSLNDLVTCRYDDLATLGRRDWPAEMRLDEPLRGWLDDMVPRQDKDFVAEL